MELTAGQLARVSKAHKNLTDVLLELGALGNSKAEPEPKWKIDLRRQWGLLKDVKDAGSDIGSDEWGRLGAQHGYDPRGLGGFFRGHEQLMAAQGARRVLTDAGRRFIERYAGDFG